MEKGDGDVANDVFNRESNYVMVFEPKEPMKTDAERHECAFRKRGNIKGNNQTKTIFKL